MKGAIRPIVLLTQLLAGCASTGAPATQGAGSAGQGISATASPEVDGQVTREASAESEAVAKQFLGNRKGGAWKVGAAYEWVTVGRLYWVTGPLDPALLVAVLGDGRPSVRLTGDIPALKSFLAMQFDGRLPGVGALNGIAQLVKDAIIGKGGTCSGIRGSLNKNEWAVEFNVINGGGGVDVVRASGTASPLTLLHISVGVVKARGAFRHPSEGLRPRAEAEPAPPWFGPLPRPEALNRTALR